jgi:hypothetical protein
MGSFDCVETMADAAAARYMNIPPLNPASFSPLFDEFRSSRMELPHGAIMMN